MKQTALLITAFQRDELLAYGLDSIKRQNYKDLRIIVINDGIPGTTEHVCKKYDVEYLFTGQRNTDKIYWRVPGYALNIGVRYCRSKNIILSCAEMFHLGPCLHHLLAPLDNQPKALCIPKGKDDHKSDYLNHLRETGRHSDIVHKTLNNLKTDLPFLMAMKRQEFMSINGYDEDFTGQSYDDDDLMGRLLANGCRYVQTEAECVHLYHSRKFVSKSEPWRLKHNRELYNLRKGVIMRNEGKAWGLPDGSLESIQQWWDRCHQEYQDDGTKVFITGSSLDQYIEFLQLEDIYGSAEKILEVGVGTCAATRHMYLEGKLLTLLDISDVALERAREYGNIRNARDIESLPADTHDLAISHLVAQHMNNDDLVYQLTYVIRSLKDTGILAIQYADAPTRNNNTLDIEKGGGVLRNVPEMTALINAAGGRIKTILSARHFATTAAWWNGMHICKE